MKTQAVILFVLFLPVLLLGGANPLKADDQVPERVIWDKKPIPVLLAVDQERLIHFPVDIRYWLPDGAERLVQALSANGVLYLQALEPFETVRIRVQAVDSQQIYLLDVTGTKGGDHAKELIVLQKEHVANRAKHAKPVVNPIDWRVRLTRFAAQSLYAPERLMPSDSEIRRVSVNTDTPIALIRGADIEAIPVASWRGGGLTVTAVRLRNLSQYMVVIAAHDNAQKTPTAEKPRFIHLATELRGQWLTASVQHSVLQAAGRDDDRTCLYLVSNTAFEASL